MLSCTMKIAIILNFLLLPASFVRAEDYPAGYLGPGHREYLSGKIQNGYYVEVFTNMDMRQKERVSKRNEIENLVGSSYQASPQSNNGILATEHQVKYNTDNLKQEIAKQRQQREKVASVQGAFNYVAYSDGSKVYTKDNLIDHIDNERVVDEFGNVSRKNSYNYQYNDKYLLIGFEADMKDSLGNMTHIRQFGMEYTRDSVSYGSDKTVANKNLLSYVLEETDHAGNKRVTTVSAQAGAYDGKMLRAFSQTIEDSIYGNTKFTRSNITYIGDDPERTQSYHEEGIGTDNLAYELDRTNITYNGKLQVDGYHEEMSVTQIDGKKAKTITDAQFTYNNTPAKFEEDVEPEGDRLAQSIITTSTKNPDGSTKTETTTTDYVYNPASLDLIKALGRSEFKGQEAKWYEYTDAQGRILNREVDANGNVKYSYTDPATQQKIYTSESEAKSTLKDGDLFSGASEIGFELLYGKPMTKEVNSSISYYNPKDGKYFRTETSKNTYTNGLVNNFQRALAAKEYTETVYPVTDPNNSHRQILELNTIYYYDALGNSDVSRAGAYSSGTRSGWEYSNERGWYGQYNREVTKTYEVILGKVLLKRSIEE